MSRLDQRKLEVLRHLDKLLEPTHRLIFGKADGEPYDYLRLVPRIQCADGFKMSVQAGESFYCYPRSSEPENGVWKSVEVYTSDIDLLLDGYGERGGVYGYVPMGVVIDIIVKHGGLA